LKAREVVSGLYVIRLGATNVFLIDSGESGLTLVDTGYPKHASAIEAGIRSVGRDPSDLSDILITHAHPDHLGSAARLSSGSIPISLPEKEKSIATSGRYEVTMSAAPGLLNRILFRLIVGSRPREFPSFEPARSLLGGETLDIAGGIEVIPTPGHSAGHMSLSWKADRNVLFTGVAVSNVKGLGYAIGYDDFETGKRSASRLAEQDFEVAVFGHGKPILSSAASAFARKFPSDQGT
jgi:glyoxylase-like metal-dependent hydrolase (beta-lactamase superfamily II)